MNYEFDPTLTQGAQNSYAEGMSEPGSSESSQTDAEAEQAAKVEAGQGINKPLESSEPKQMAREMAHNFYDELRKRMKEEEATDRAQLIAEGRLSEEKLRDAEESHRAQQSDPFLRERDTVLNPNASPSVQRQAMRNLKQVAQELISGGFGGEEIEALAKIDLSRASSGEIERTLKNAFNNDAFQQAVAEATESGPMGPGGMGPNGMPNPRSKDDIESYMNMYYPPSLEDVAAKAIDLESEEWRPGGKHEILDAEGNLKIWNLRRWMEEKWLHWGHQLSPDDPQQQPWNSVAILSLYTQIDLMRLLTTSRYWRTREEIKTTDASGKIVVSYRYHKSEAYENLRADLLDQFWLFGKAHEFDASVRPLKGSEGDYLKGIAQLYGKNVFLQGRDRLMKAWKKDATSGSEEELQREYDAWMRERGTGGPQVEGRAGRAHRHADALYLRMAQIEKWRDEKGEDYIARMGRNYNYSDNRFYEDLGPEGVRAFYTSFITRGMGGFEGMYSKSLEVVEQINAAVDLEGVDIAAVMISPRDIGRNLTSGANLRKVQSYFRKEVLGDMLREQYKELPPAQREEKVAEAIGEWSITTIDTYIDKYQPQQREDIERRVSEKIRSLMVQIPQEIEGVREAILSRLTGWDSQGRRLDIKGVAGFRDAGGQYVRDLFKRAQSDPMALEELGLRFVSLKVGDKNKSSDWEAGRGSKKWKGAWKDTRKELNLFNAQSKPRELDDAVRKAIRDAIGKVNGIDYFDAEYAENFAFAKVYFTFTSGYNDTTATGFDAATKLLRFMDYRKNNMFGRKNFVGNTQNITGVKRLLLTLWEGAYGSIEQPDGSRKKASLLSVMEHGFTDGTRRRGNENTLQTIDFDRYKESTFGSNHILSAFSIYERILKGPMFDFAKSIKIDNYGNVQTDPSAVADALNQVNKGIRYTYNQLGLNFEDMEEEVEIIWERDEDGKMSPTPVFKKRKLKDALFAQEVVNMGMYEDREFKGNWVNKRIGMKDANGEDMLTEYSRNVIAYYIAKEILEHRLYSPKDSSYNYAIWNLDMIRAIEAFFANIPGGELEEIDIGLFNKNKKMRKTGSFFNSKEFKKIRKMANATYGKLWMEELRAQLAETAWKGSTGTSNKWFSYIFQDMWSFK